RLAKKEKRNAGGEEDCQNDEGRTPHTASNSEIVLIRCDDWIGLEMYAFAPRARPRSRSSSAPSVVMMMIGMCFSCAFCRTSDTSLRPSITGMLMSVRIRSIFSGPESFLSASTPSTASMILAFLNRLSEKEINWRMVGESSTTRKFAFSNAKALRLSLICSEQIEEALNRVQLPFGLRVELR